MRREDPDTSNALLLVASDARFANLGTLISSVTGASTTYGNAVRDILTELDLDTGDRYGGRRGFSDLDASSQLEELGTWDERLDNLQDITNLNAIWREASSEGLNGLVEQSFQWSEASEHLCDALETAWYEAIVERGHREHPILSTFDSDAHRAAVKRFGDLDRASLKANSSKVLAAHRRRLANLGDPTQDRILRTEFEKRRRHLPIRRLIQQAGGAVQAIKPVFMMSPLSVAAYIPLGSIDFDVVIFDEASQIRPAEAFGALLRARQAVVCGDSEQLPPTKFFDSLVGGDDDDYDRQSPTRDIESLLGLFRANGVPSRSLLWHYRSRHESLIALSNREFYNNRLLVFASPDADRSESGLTLHPMPPHAVYDRGRSRTNRVEAREVASAVMQHAKSRPDLSLGVAAFSLAQANEIRYAIEESRRKDRSAERFFSDHPAEPFFVKNLESVQGDEREVIFISVGYGRNDAGQISLNFGPLNGQGGHRRLNVLITRARTRCDVFTNLTADDIELSRTASRGVRVLKTFLEYAQSGRLPVDTAYASSRESGSPFQDAVAVALRGRGYQLHEEVASGGKFVDIAIVDPDAPGRYVLGIETDGATYHSSLRARDRDRLREQVLEGLGWRLHRIWSTDWFKNPERQLNRAVKEIETALRIAKAAPAGNIASDERDRAEAAHDSQADSTSSDDALGRSEAEFPIAVGAPRTGVEDQQSGNASVGIESSLTEEVARSLTNLGHTVCGEFVIGAARFDLGIVDDSNGAPILGIRLSTADYPLPGWSGPGLVEAGILTFCVDESDWATERGQLLDSIEAEIRQTKIGEPNTSKLAGDVDSQSIVNLSRFHQQDGVAQPVEAIGALDPETAFASFRSAVVRAVWESGFVIQDSERHRRAGNELWILDPNDHVSCIVAVNLEFGGSPSAAESFDAGSTRTNTGQAPSVVWHEIHWSNWRKDPRQEATRLRNVISNAVAAKNQVHVPDPPSPSTPYEQHDEVNKNTLAIQQYRIAHPTFDLRNAALHEVSPQCLLEPIVDVVRVEGPIHDLEAAKRVANSVGIKRVGRKIRANFDKAVLAAVRAGLIRKSGPFLSDPKSPVTVVRSRTNCPSHFRNIELVAPEELDAAIRQVIHTQQSHGLGAKTVLSEVAVLLGFGRKTNSFNRRVRNRIKLMADSGEVDWEGDLLRLRTSWRE